MRVKTKVGEMQTLSKGFKKPANPDTGDIFYDALALNAQLTNDHTHDGSNSTLLATTTATIQSASWSATAGLSGIYEQTITVPAGFTYDNAQIWFKLSSGEFVYPSTARVSSTQYKVYTANNSLTYTAFYR
jgi:hypothetical protein